MILTPVAIYAAHLIFWSSFAVRWIGPKPVATERPSSSETPSHTARYPRLFPILHGFAFGALYFAIGNSVFHDFPGIILFSGQDVVGCALILAGASFAAWSMRVFKSWRLTAEIDAGHELCTDGPFGIVRHPIYLAFDLIAAGSAVWLPSAFSASALAAVIVVGDLRARNEEQLLRGAFKERYLEYMRATRRFVPFVY